MFFNQMLFFIVSKATSTWRGQQYSLALFPIWINAVTTACANVFFHRPLGFSEPIGTFVNVLWVLWDLGLMSILLPAVRFRGCEWE